jgi:hypothetical protein
LGAAVDLDKLREGILAVPLANFLDGILALVLGNFLEGIFLLPCDSLREGVFAIDQPRSIGGCFWNMDKPRSRHGKLKLGRMSAKLRPHD